MSKVIKFKRAHFDHIGTFINLTEWGFIDGGFASPSSIYGEDKKRAVDLQFTGLHDQNGKEIYEGDIVILPGGTNKSVIEYNDGAYHFSFEEFEINPIRQDRTKRWEIIGNVYQNPELLK